MAIISIIGNGTPTFFTPNLFCYVNYNRYRVKNVLIELMRYVLINFCRPESFVSVFHRLYV